MCAKTFIENYTELLQMLKNKKHIICGDFNIDIKKCETNDETNLFLDSIYSFSQYLLINVPIRITDTSATIIGIFFTNVINGESKSRVLIDDITVYLPIIFTLPGSMYKTNTETEYHYKRMVNKKVLVH